MIHVGGNVDAYQNNVLHLHVEKIFINENDRLTSVNLQTRNKNCSNLS